MRKDNKAHKHTSTDDSLRKELHDLWDSCDDEMERLELKHFVGSDNMPDIRALNGSGDSIGVDEVLIIGGYMALNKVHQLVHQSETSSMTDKVEDLFDGKVSVREIISADMPDEVVEVLEDLVDIVKKNRKRGGKK